GVTVEQVVHCCTLTQLAQDELDCDPGSSDDGFPEHHVWARLDSVVLGHAAPCLSRGRSIIRPMTSPCRGVSSRSLYSPASHRRASSSPLIPTIARACSSKSRYASSGPRR